MPNFSKKPWGAETVSYETTVAPGRRRQKMTRDPLTLVSPSVIPLTASDGLHQSERDPPPPFFYLLENID